MIDYPEAWGVLWHDGSQSGWAFPLCRNEPEAVMCTANHAQATVVCLIPAPVVERMIAEAVAAERERCIRACIAERNQWREVGDETGAGMSSIGVVACMHCEELILSGIEPGKVGE